LPEDIQEVNRLPEAPSPPTAKAIAAEGSVIFMESDAAAEWDAALVSAQTLAWVSA
jgi:hypothetical protein